MNKVKKIKDMEPGIDVFNFKEEEFVTIKVGDFSSKWWWCKPRKANIFHSWSQLRAESKHEIIGRLLPDGSLEKPND